MSEGGASGGRPREADLAEAERWLTDAIVGPSKGAASGAMGRDTAGAPRPRVEALVRGTPALSAEDRVAIYRHAYRARLVECLMDDFGVLGHAMGPEAFTVLAHAYIDAHPPRAATLNRYGEAFPAFVHHREDLGIPGPFAADLAALEWAVVEVIHAPIRPVLTAEDVARVKESEWPAARLHVSAAARVLRSSYPVSAFFGAVRSGEQPPIPAARACATLVHRRDTVVWRFELSAPQVALLGDLAAGAPLGAALGRLESEHADATTSVGAWFQEWVAGGVFSGLTQG